MALGLSTSTSSTSTLSSLESRCRITLAQRLLTEQAFPVCDPLTNSENAPEIEEKSKREVSQADAIVVIAGADGKDNEHAARFTQYLLGSGNGGYHAIYSTQTSDDSDEKWQPGFDDCVLVLHNNAVAMLAPATDRNLALAGQFDNTNTFFCLKDDYQLAENQELFKMSAFRKMLPSKGSTLGFAFQKKGTYLTYF